MSRRNRLITGETIGCSAYLIWILIVIAFGIGWVINIIKFSKCDFKEPYKEEAIRAVGLIPPIGGIVGWLHIEDGEPVVKPEPPKK